ncbi:TIGR02206 family membrane protein [Nocardioides panzhihuensis]|uniref:Putative integral membrane protein (TIGR02206 family) n=1 Tax=Nocardioides panzhihuensis TaxID=860243 RepID=A0A7Z0DRD5_9ACTN|nr:TIGR02206 family membrane protein [Nocardioides panzhihuensis]NYI79974.1 putative integral membrane protein (TIGR02206 family) [Nocardioides panzhihuensis]
MQAYGLTHLVPLSLLTAGIVAMVWLGRRQRSEARPSRFSRGFALAIPLTTIPLQAHEWVTDFDLFIDLPIHLCDLAWIAAAVALWTHHPYPTALTCFWGLTLTTQGVFTPDVQDLPDVSYFTFWGLHLMIVLAAVYLIFGLKLLPRWRDYGWVVATTALWAAAAYVLNLVLDANYGYLRYKPESASMLDLLGPWPVYILNEILLVAGIWALITLGLRMWARQDGSTRTPVRS